MVGPHQLVFVYVYVINRVQRGDLRRDRRPLARAVTRRRRRHSPHSFLNSYFHPDGIPAQHGRVLVVDRLRVNVARVRRFRQQRALLSGAEWVDDVVRTREHAVQPDLRVLAQLGFLYGCGYTRKMRTRVITGA